jgi:hypothetical protein
MLDDLAHIRIVAFHPVFTDTEIDFAKLQLSHRGITFKLPIFPMFFDVENLVCLHPINLAHLNLPKLPAFAEINA